MRHPEPQRHPGNAYAGFRLPRTSIEERVHFDTHLLLWQHRGRSVMRVDGRTVTVDAEHVCLVQAGVPHAVEAHAGSIVIPLFMRLGLPLEGLPVGLVRPVDADLREMLMALVQYESPLLRADLDIEHIVAEHLRASRAGHGAPPMPSSPEALGIAHQIIAHPDDTSPIASYAEAAFVSHRTVERQFRQETGLTPQQWRTHSRLAHAAELMQAGTAPEVALVAVGYFEAASFRRAFRNKFGVTPRQFVAREPNRVGATPQS